MSMRKSWITIYGFARVENVDNDSPVGKVLAYAPASTVQVQPPFTILAFRTWVAHYWVVGRRVSGTFGGHAMVKASVVPNFFADSHAVGSDLQVNIAKDIDPFAVHDIADILQFRSQSDPPWYSDARRKVDASESIMLSMESWVTGATFQSTSRVSDKVVSLRVAVTGRILVGYYG